MSGEDIIRLYRDGHKEQAFNELVKSYSERLYWQIRNLVGSHEDADDILQDVFVKIWAALPSYRGDAQLFTWVYRIATNEALNFLKKKKLKTIFFGPDEVIEQSSDPYFDGTRAQGLLRKAIMGLPPRQRAVFNMRYFDEMPYEDISAIMGVSESSLKASYHFAYEKVRKYLEDNSV